MRRILFMTILFAAFPLVPCLGQEKLIQEIVNLFKWRDASFQKNHQHLAQAMEKLEAQREKTFHRYDEMLEARRGEAERRRDQRMEILERTFDKAMEELERKHEELERQLEANREKIEREMEQGFQQMERQSERSRQEMEEKFSRMTMEIESRFQKANEKIMHEFQKKIHHLRTASLHPSVGKDPHQPRRETATEFYLQEKKASPKKALIKEVHPEVKILTVPKGEAAPGLRVRARKMSAPTPEADEGSGEIHEVRQELKELETRRGRLEKRLKALEKAGNRDRRGELKDKFQRKKKDQ